MESATGNSKREKSERDNKIPKMEGEPRPAHKKQTFSFSLAFPRDLRTMYSSHTPHLSPPLLPSSTSTSSPHLLRILCTSSSSSSPIQRNNNNNPFSPPIPLNRPIYNPEPPLLRDKPPRHTNDNKIMTLQLMGFDTDRIQSKNPAFRHASLDSLLQTVNYLQSKGICLTETVRIVDICPDIITADIDNDLAPVFDFLSEDLQVKDEHFHLVINKCPRILAVSARDQLKPALKFLHRIGIKSKFLLSYKYTNLLVLDVKNTIIPKLQFLLSIGFSHKEVEFLVSRKPDLLASSIAESIKPKAEYFFREIKGTLEELREFPHYFTYCLEGRIKPRHRELVDRGVEMPLRVMLTSMDVEFTKLVSQLEKDNRIEPSNFCAV